MKKLFTLVTMMILLGVNRAWAGPYVYFNESSKVLNAGATSFDFMSNQLMSSGISTNSGTQQTVFSGWVVFNENAKMTYSGTNNGGTAYGDPHDIIDIGSGQFNNINALQAGWTLRVNFDFAQDDWYGWFFKNHTTEVYPPIQNNLNKVDGWHQVTLNGNTFWSMYGYYEAVLTADAVTYLKGNGINLRGRSITIQSVEVIPPATTFDANSFDWTAETYGEVELTSGYINKSGNAYTLNPSNPSLALNGEGGSIVFIANGKSGTAVAGYRAYYVVTVPYPDNHVWDFFTDPGITPRSDANWTDDYKSKPQNEDPKRKIKVATPNESATDGYNYIYRTNAFYIPETAGLLFDVKSARLGYNNEEGKKLVTWGGYHITSTGSNNDGTHPKFTIPQVKGGKYIKVWWNAMDRGQGGGRFKVNNLLDLEGVSVDNLFTITGVTEYSKCEGVIIFKVNGSTSERKDITFEMQDEGWNDIYKIEITDIYETDMVLFQCQDTDSGWNVGGGVEYNNEFASIVHKNGEKAERYYNGTSPKAILNRGFTCDFNVASEGGVTFNSEVLSVGNNVKYNYLHLTNIDGTGNIKITQKERFGAVEGQFAGYVLNKKETWLAVGEYTQQSYPYTWDFTDYNVSQGSLYAWLSGSNTYGTQKYGHWKMKNSETYALETHEQVNGTILNGQTNQYEKVDKPLFAQGAQLTYWKQDNTIGIIKEAEGLRVKQAWGTNGGLAVGEVFDGELSIDGKSLKYTPADKWSRLHITIPNVDAGMYVFIKADDGTEAENYANPNVKSGNTELTVDNSYNTKNKVRAYKVTTTGDVDITFSKAARIKAIGVTNIFKSINALGYATESRDVDIDHIYEGEFTKNDVNAYCIQTYNDEGFTYEYKGTPIVKKSQVMNVIPKNTGIVLYKEGHSGDAFNVPLFYPACNAKVEEAEQTALDNNWMAPNVASTEHTSVTETWHNVECQKFVMSRQYYVYHKSSDGTGSNSGELTSEQEAFYRMRLNSGVQGTSNTMGANKAYLLIPTAKLPLALWNPQSNGEGKPGLAKSGVIFMDDIMDLFSEDEPSGIATAIDDAIESTETVGNGNTFHTLSGMQIQGVPTQKGVYIVNGKKVLVK